MWNSSQESPIACLARYVSTWKKREGLSNATVADEIVNAHYQIQGHIRTGIVFEPNSSDEYNRMKANAARIFRWLDDVSEESNLLSLNFYPSIVAALPADLRVSYLNELHAPLGLCMTGLTPAEEGDINLTTLAKMIKEDSDAHQAVAAAIDSGCVNTLSKADKEIGEAIEVKTQARKVIASKLSKLVKIFHRPARA